MSKTYATEADAIAHMSSCGGLATQLAPTPDPDSAAFAPHPSGTRVVVIGLAKATHLNGQVRCWQWGRAVRSTQCIK